jgi:threonine dehydratase
MIDLDRFKQARARIQGVAMETPLLPYSGSDSNGALYFKPENLQPVGAFKIRGAYNKIATLSSESQARGVVAFSSGNHAQGVAYSALKLGIRATIVMPETAPPIKIENTRRFGAEVVLVGKGGEVERQKIAEKIARKNRSEIIPPFDDEMVIAGQGTIGLELLEQCPDVVNVLIPIGGGGLIAGVSTCLKLQNPKVNIIGIEPELGNDTQLSLAKGEIVTIDTDQAVSTIADGMRITHPGNLTFPYIKEFVDKVLTVSEQEILSATGQIIRETRMLVEPSGATTFAAWLKYRHQLHPGKTVAILSGGNIDPTLLFSLLQQP